MTPADWECGCCQLCHPCGAEMCLGCGCKCLRCGGPIEVCECTDRELNAELQEKSAEADRVAESEDDPNLPEGLARGRGRCSSTLPKSTTGATAPGLLFLAGAS